VCAPEEELNCVVWICPPSFVSNPAFVPTPTPHRNIYTPAALSFRAGTKGALLLVVPSDASATTSAAAAEAEALAGAGAPGLERLTSLRPLQRARRAHEQPAWPAA
jgi:hypothetical protein